MAETWSTRYAVEEVSVEVVAVSAAPTEAESREMRWYLVGRGAAIGGLVGALYAARAADES